MGVEPEWTDTESKEINDKDFLAKFDANSGGMVLKGQPPILKN